MNAPTIQLNELSFRYRKVQALDRVDLEIRSGEIFALLGPNGAGKTTLIDILVGLLRPDSGTARVLGVDSTRLSPADLAQIGYVSEEQEWPARMTLKRLINHISPLYPSWDSDLCEELRRRFELKLDRKLGGLSRGQRMRVRLLLAASYRPRLLVLDEPFSGLDPMVREDVIEGILDLTDQESWAVLLATHEMATVERLADRVGFLADGELWLAEGIESLRERCRRVNAKLSEPLPTKFRWPAAWSQRQVEGRQVRFLDAAADSSSDTEPAETYGALPGLQSVSTSEASLEQIFIALHRQRAQTPHPHATAAKHV